MHQDMTWLLTGYREVMSLGS
uniref:Uncharacterized protein n=1 Tax=Anguilla anguilla TaxID=7936 RepID=A0A0E9PBZ6_ANGAN